MPYQVAAGDPGAAVPQTVNLRWPVCRHQGAFHLIRNDILDAQWQQQAVGKIASYMGGVRQCPNLECKAIVFVVLAGGKLVESFPPEVIDFDSTNLPDSLLATLEEAIRCHSTKSYRASALMGGPDLLHSHLGRPMHNARRVNVCYIHCPIPRRTGFGFESLRIRHSVD